MAAKLFVGNLPYTISDAQLSDIFAKIGNVVSAHIITDRYSGRSKGFGFVEMDSPDAAQKAIQELNGKPLEGRNLVVSEAREKVERPRA